VQTVFCSGVLTDCGFENASAKCGPSRLDSLSAGSSVFTEDARRHRTRSKLTRESRNGRFLERKSSPKLQRYGTLRPPKCPLSVEEAEKHLLVRSFSHFDPFRKLV
jgi:hypothetical protein